MTRALVCAALLLIVAPAHAAPVHDSIRFIAPLYNLLPGSCDPDTMSPCVDLAGVIVYGQRSDVCAPDSQMDERELGRMSLPPPRFDPPNSTHVIPWPPVVVYFDVPSQGMWWYRLAFFRSNGNESCRSRSQLMHDLRPQRFTSPPTTRAR